MDFFDIKNIKALISQFLLKFSSFFYFILKKKDNEYT